MNEAIKQGVRERGMKPRAGSGNRETNACARKLVRQYVLHDLLPWQDDSEGLTVKQLVALLVDMGYACQPDTVARDLRELDEFVYLERYTLNGTVYWKRLYETSITQALSDPPSLPPVLGCNGADNVGHGGT